ncbi:MAG: endonuclease/exonuclease/phosphatase family protein [Actinomycetes bacterium]
MSLRIVTWNVRSLRDDRLAVVQVLRSLAPDVVALQEVPRFLRSRSRLAALARESGLLVACGGRSSAGTALLAALRIDVLRSSEALLPPSPRLHRRGVAIAEVRVSGSGGPSLVVACVHLGLNSGERARHAQVVRELVGAYQNQATVIAGDLNEWPGRPAWQTLWSGHSDPGDEAAAATFPSRHPEHRIDVVFVPEGSAATCEVVTGPAIAAASDHCPVVVDLQW